MLDVLLDALLDAGKALPFLFGAYLFLEFLEHRASGRLTGLLSHAGPLGPVLGAGLGLIPQCGVSVAAANLYAGRVIGPGTLLAVFLATSDEALPILLANPGAGENILRLLGVKFVAAAVFGVVIELTARRLRPAPQPLVDLCEDGHHEHEGIFRAAARHTGKVFLFLLLVNAALGLGIHLVGEENISRFLLSGSVWQPLLAALIGFIPNCAASVILTELYLAGSLSFGSAIAGLCTGAGMGLLVLFRANKAPRENLALAAALYVCAVLAGCAAGLLG